MAKVKTVNVVTKIVALLEPVNSDERLRIVRAAFMLLGENASAGASAAAFNVPTMGRQIVSNGSLTEKAYFDSKQANSKLEELAVAARFREDNENAMASSRADLQKVIRAARRNFDGHNFKRDIDNARKAGLFTRSTGRDSFELSHYGQNYVDALPDREALKALRRPKGSRRAAKKKPTKRKQ